MSAKAGYKIRQSIVAQTRWMMPRCAQLSFAQDLITLLERMATR